MNDVEIREAVRTKRLNLEIASDVVPGRHTPILMEGGGPFSESCVMCADGRSTHVRFSATIAFHEWCYADWLRRDPLPDS